MTSIEIPNSVKEIGGCAFADCTSLTSIKIPNSVAEIYYGAFWGCANLTSIEIPDSVSEIGDKAFYKCDNLKEITLPDNFESMALGDLKNMGIDPWKTKIYVQDKDGNAENAKEHPIMSQVGEQNGLRYYIDGDHIVIDSYVGDGKDITIPSEINGMPVTEISKGAFYNNTSIKSVIIPNSVTKIGKGAFKKCTSLTSIKNPDSVTEIGERAFAYCERLTSITIPDSVTEIGKSAFKGCDNLKSITLPEAFASKTPEELQLMGFNPDKVNNDPTQANPAVEQSAPSNSSITYHGHCGHFGNEEKKAINGKDPNKSRKPHH